MFATAYEKAKKFTHPVIISTLKWNGDVKCGCGSFIILNKEGWILTASHILRPMLSFKEDQEAIQKHQQKVDTIEKDTGLTAKQKKKKVRKLHTNPNWLKDHSLWWGEDNRVIEEFIYYLLGDIAVGRIKNFQPPSSITYPKFKNPKNIRIGTFLCKLGFPFHTIKATYDARKGFVIEDGILPLPYFPYEGMFTRNRHEVFPGKTLKYEVKFIETSTPGLGGQSGGPIFDKEGVVWALQSKTAHYPLGFNPTIKKNGKDIEEHQFLNFGLGVHPELIVDFLTDNKINFDLVD